MKRLIPLTLCLALAFAGCQAKPSSDTASSTPQSTANQAVPSNDVSAEVGSDAAVQANETTVQANETTVQASIVPVLTAQKPEINGDVVEITESLFVAQLNEIYLNQNDYLGKTIKYEGMFTRYTWEETGMTYYLVYRDSPGCCGADGQAGFEVIWPDGADDAYPADNDWCEVVGTLEEYDEDGEKYLHIVLDKLTVKSERGAEFVSQ